MAGPSAFAGRSVTVMHAPGNDRKRQRRATGLAPGWAGARADQLSKQIMGQGPSNHTDQTDAQTTADSRRCAPSSNRLFKEPSTGTTRWAQQGSNLWPPGCKPGALPLSYAPSLVPARVRDGIPARVPGPGDW